MMVITSMTDEQVDEFEKLPVEEQKKQIGFAMLAQLNPLSEWFTDDGIYDLRRELASS